MRHQLPQFFLKYFQVMIFGRHFLDGNTLIRNLASLGLLIFSAKKALLAYLI